MIEETENPTVRLSVPIDRELNDKFAAMIPHRLKAEVVRCLVELTLKTQIELGKDEYLIHYLIDKRCKLVIDK